MSKEEEIVRDDWDAFYYRSSILPLLMDGLRSVGFAPAHHFPVPNEEETKVGSTARRVFFQRFEQEYRLFQRRESRLPSLDELQDLTDRLRRLPSREESRVALTQYINDVAKRFRVLH